MLTKEELEIMLKMALDTIKSRETTIQMLLAKMEKERPKEHKEFKILDDGIATKPL